MMSSNFGTRPLPAKVDCPVCHGAGMVDESVHQKGPDATSEVCWGCFGQAGVTRGTAASLRRILERRVRR